VFRETMSVPHWPISRTPIHPHHHSPFAFLAMASLITCMLLAFAIAGAIAVVWWIIARVMGAN